MGFKARSKRVFWALMRDTDDDEESMYELTPGEEKPSLREEKNWEGDRTYNVLDVPEDDAYETEYCCQQCDGCTLEEYEEEYARYRFKYTLCPTGWKAITGLKLKPGKLTKLTIDVKVIG